MYGAYLTNRDSSGNFLEREDEGCYNYMVPEGKEAADIIKGFVNDRLIGLMEDVIIEEAIFAGTLRDSISSEDMTRPLEELVDIDHLCEDMDFARNVVSLYLPEGFLPEKANYEFFSLYRLLRAKGDYKPSLPMEYILFYLIMEEIGEVNPTNELFGEGAYDELKDFHDDNDMEESSAEECSTVKRIPEPDRTVVLKAIQENCETEDDPEDLMKWYEDLREYVELCFEDTDFLLLDDIEEDVLYRSELAEVIGISRRPDVLMTEMNYGEGVPVHMSFRIAPWDLE